MSKKAIVAILVILGVIGVLGVFSIAPKKESGNGQTATLNPAPKQKKDTNNMSISVAPAQKVEVFLSHRTQRCAICIAIGKLSGQTVEERFRPEVLGGKVVFREINIDEPQNKELAEKFQASGSSLFINAVKEGSDNIQEDMEVWRLTNSPDDFKNYLAGKINNLLGKQ